MVYILFLTPYFVYLVAAIIGAIRSGLSLLYIVSEAVVGIIPLVSLLLFLVVFIYFDLYRGFGSLTIPNAPIILLAWAMAIVICCAMSHLWFGIAAIRCYFYAAKL